MNNDRLRRALPIFWQVSFILLATTWLWAPSLNHLLSERVSLISQYEVLGQPFAWLFKTGDAIAACLLIGLVIYQLRRQRSLEAYILLVIGIGMLIDPLWSTNCHMTGNTCQEYFSFNFLAHAIETVVTGTALFLIAIYDYWRRKRLVSAVFVVFQIAYFLLFLSQWVDQDHFNTFSQYVFQLTVVIWLAWYVRDRWFKQTWRPSPRQATIVKRAAAIWVLANGLLAIVLSLGHIHLLGKISGLYFAGHSAWLAQHGVVVGIVMIYLSRQLERGEQRARQLFLLIAGIEVVKYSVITPNPPLMLVYFLSFVGLFVLGEVFDRGTKPLTLKTRLKDALYVLGGVTAAALIALLILHRNPEAAADTNQSLHNFVNFTVRRNPIAKHQMTSELLAHTESAFLLAALAAVLWALFRPQHRLGHSGDRSAEAAELVRRYSSSSEDYFKLWLNSEGKRHFWSTRADGFVTYKSTGQISFALADPISAASDQPAVLADFVADCRTNGLTACFLPVYEASLKLYQKAGLVTVQIGSSAIINCRQFTDSTVKDKWWRWQRNRAEKAGYTYHISQPPHEHQLMNDFKHISDDWLASNNHHERGFGLGYFDETYLNHCPIHYLKNNQGQVLAFTNQLPRLGKTKVATVDLMRFQPGNNNSMPYLLSKVIDRVHHQAEAKYFDLGFVPFTGSKELPVRLAKLLSTRLFSAGGLEQFKNKFDPQWSPNYLAYDGDLGDLAAVAVNIEKAMSVSNPKRKG